MINLGMLIFAEGEKPENPEKTLEARERTNNKLNSHMTPSPGIEHEITVVSCHYANYAFKLYQLTNCISNPCYMVHQLVRGEYLNHYSKPTL
jgi:hypothetical protein